MARRRTYADTPHNRRLGRVGKPYGWTPPLTDPRAHQPVPLDPERVNPTRGSQSRRRPTSAPNPAPLFTNEPVPVDLERVNPPRDADSRRRRGSSGGGSSRGSSSDMPFGGTFVTRDEPFSAEDTKTGEQNQKGTDRKRTPDKSSKWMKHAGKLKGLALWTLIPMLLADMLQHGKGYGAAGRADALKKMEGKIQKRDIMTTPNRLAAMQDSSNLMGTLGAMQKALNAPEKRKYSEAFGRSPRVFGKDRI